MCNNCQKDSIELDADHDCCRRWSSLSPCPESAKLVRVFQGTTLWTESKAQWCTEEYEAPPLKCRYLFPFPGQLLYLGPLFWCPVCQWFIRYLLQLAFALGPADPAVTLCSPKLIYYYFIWDTQWPHSPCPAYPGWLSKHLRGRVPKGERPSQRVGCFLTSSRRPT